MQDVDVIKAREGIGVKPVRERRESEALQRRKKEGGKVKPFREGRGRESEILQRRKRDGK